ncbi:nitroreductase/quinone reductase family protein [Promicromonospora sukumoe]|uniref:nitroreductase/quinone reductase family protein n=1 Tax=Promicromonospora sukumoe TaxID=88382 RepID=UPI00366789DA
MSTTPPTGQTGTVTVLRDVRPWGGERSDLHVADGVITAVVPHDPAAPAGSAGVVEPGVVEPGVVEGKGLLALPGLVNAHAHVDKSWWGKPWVSYGGEPGTQGRIAHERAHRDELGIPGVDVTLAVLRESVRTGTTAVRSHVDVDLGVGSLGGAPKDPVWVANVEDGTGETTIEVGDQTLQATTTVVRPTSPEWERLYGLWAEYWPDAKEYETHTDRKFPVIRLEPKA